MDSANDIPAFKADAHQGAMCIIGIDKLLSKSDLAGVKLSRKALSMNRNHYAALILLRSRFCRRDFLCLNWRKP